ncbi:MAG: insulinase family protein [Treponema sp.]|nr:insulinase family protein [Treponema sp.]
MVHKLKLRGLLPLFAILAIFISCSGLPAPQFGGLGAAADPVPLMSGTRTGVLPSGLRYFLFENTQPEGRAYLTLAVNAGSVLEEEDERGLAHFVEHMAFNGTARFEKSELINYLRSLGMRFGPEINAYTSFDETVYGIEVPVLSGADGRKRIPDRALEVIDDWAFGLLFNPEEVESERLVILEEYRSRLGARERINQQLFPVLFRDSLYAERLPIGLLEILESAPPQRLQGFYERWYRPENMALIIVGDFDAEYLEASLSEHFPDHWAGPDPAFYRPRHELRAPERGAFQSLIITDSELSQSRLDLYWKRQPREHRGDLAAYREAVIDYLISIMLSLRFDEDALKSDSPYVWAGAGRANYGYSSRFYLMAAGAKTGAARESLWELLVVKESLSRHGFSQGELDAAKAFLVSNLEQEVSEIDRQHSNIHINSFTRHFIRGDAAPDPLWELVTVNRLLGGINLREINRTVRAYFAEDDLTLIITAPEDEEDSLPGEDEIRALLAQAGRARIAAPDRGRAQGELLGYVPAAGQILSESADSETGALRLMLSNGAEVILKETQNRNNEISLYAQARGGTLSAPDHAAVSASLAAEMISVSGLGPHSRPELTRLLMDKQVSMSFWTQNFLRGFQGSAALQDAKTLFEMIYLGFTQPRLESEAVAAMLDQLHSRLLFQENDPNTVFRQEISRTINGNPRFHPLEAADLSRADMDDALDFIIRCLNPGDYTFVFTGNIDLPLLRPLIETYLASIPVQPAFDQWADMDPLRPDSIEREIRRGIEERSSVYLSWFSPQPFSEEKSAVVSALSEYLDIVLTDEIRERLGGVYSISSWVSISPIPRGELSGGAFFVCDPGRVEELIPVVLEEFHKIARGNIDGGTFDKAIEALIQAQEESVQRNLFIAQSYANSAVIFNSPLSRLDRRPALFRSLSTTDIQLAAAELIEGSLVRLVLYPIY